jgi:hypothetical protein
MHYIIAILRLVVIVMAARNEKSSTVDDENFYGLDRIFTCRTKIIKVLLETKSQVLWMMRTSTD